MNDLEWYSSLHSDDVNRRGWAHIPLFCACYRIEQQEGDFMNIYALLDCKRVCALRVTGRTEIIHLFSANLGAN